MKNRRIEIDFLRGIAILIVVFYHFKSIAVFNRIGWMGVDLFFVLSGYLVSGLLFKEYLKYNTINSKLFLIRRGFKIYPVFYVFVIIGIFLKIAFHEKIIPNKALFECLFIKNYTGGLSWPHTWSLCVEEHFYFIVTIGFFVLAQKKLLHHKKLMNTIFLCILIFCLVSRIGCSFFIPFYKKHTNLLYVQTHFRIDTLTCGVMIAWHRFFNKEDFMNFFKKMHKFLLPIALLFLLPAFLIRSDSDAQTFHDPYIRTVGFTSLYIGFGLVLIYFVIKDNIVSVLNKTLSKSLVKIISATGVYSYSIYLFHPLVKNYIAEFINLDYRIVFVIYVLLSCLIGAFISKFIEYHFLKIRDRHFPSRSGSIQKVQDSTPINNKLSFEQLQS